MKPFGNFADSWMSISSENDSQPYPPGNPINWIAFFFNKHVNGEAVAKGEVGEMW